MRHSMTEMLSNGVAVCIFGDYNPDYPRQVIIKRGLKENGIAVFECNCYIKHLNSSSNIFLYLFKAYRRLLKEFLVVRHKFSAFIVPHNNHLIVPLAWLLTRLYKKKLIMDAFDPAYRTALMQGLSPLQARIRYYLEKMALMLSDLVLVTTDEFRKLYIEDYAIKSAKIFGIPAGADQEKFYPREVREKKSGPFIVLYWGNFHPHHGVEVILCAAQLLQKESDIHFVLVGSGLNAKKYVKLAKDKGLHNIEFPGFLPAEELFDLIACADVCLGIFSNQRLALCSVTNKVFQALAMGKAVITERSPAIEEWFCHKEHLYTVPPDDPNQLVKAILEIKNSPELQVYLSRNGRDLFVKEFSEVRIGDRLKSVIE